MNENEPSMPSPAAPADFNPGSPTPSPLPRPLLWWVRKLFACNPFYLLSAALLLFGCYRVSVDAPLFNQETARMLFNFTSVQVYEVLLVGTAIFLARRRLWYDSTLLVGLENLLVFVPFILISLAALIDSSLAWTMCFAGAAIAVARFGSLKKYFPQLNLPGPLLPIGSVLLLLNVLLPLLYRHFGQTKIGLLDSGAAYEMNECTWQFILPAALALVNYLPRPQFTGSLLPQHRWLPLGWVALWLTVTGVHVYSLDYVYEFGFRGELLAPVAWVFAWTVSRQCAGSALLFKSASLIPAALAPLIAWAPNGNKTFLVLTLLNLTGYGLMRFWDRRNRLVSHLAFASVVLFLAGLPAAWLRFVDPGLSPIGVLTAGLIGYLVFGIVWSRNPKLALLGSFVGGWAIAIVFQDHAAVMHWAFQGALVFLLLHSLRWHDAEHPGAGFLRLAASLIWVIASFIWVHSGAGRFWMPCLPGALVLIIAGSLSIRYWQWNRFIVLAAAALVILAGPFGTMFDRLCGLPVGLLAVAGSFLLFGSGTAAALTRHHWHQPDQDAPASSGG